MCASRLVYDFDPLIAFACARIEGFARCDGMRGIGLERNGSLVAVVIYEGINRYNLWMHVAADDGKRWMTRGFLRAAFAYPFLGCGVRRVSGYVDAGNATARRFNEHLGFKVEAVLTGAAKDGSDVLIYRMLRKECRHVALSQI